MPRRTTPSTRESGAARSKTFHVLLVDADAASRRTLAEAISGDHLELVQAANLVEARRCLTERAFDLALIEPSLPDGSGLSLAHELGRGPARTQTILITGQPSLERALEAIRCGVADLIVKHIQVDEANQRVHDALLRRKNDLKLQRRVNRLQRVCQKLSAARDEVSQQVDILCNDLVTAYQELASQMSRAAKTGEFAGMVGEELDLERLLRRTLEYMLHKLGPTNAAVFLPANADEYALGGYVNYDCTKDSADMLLQHLADVVAPRVAENDTPVYITDNATLYEWIGDDGAYLEDSHVLAFACFQDREPLAVLVLFRDRREPFDPKAVEACTGIAPLLAERLVKIIRVHHRHMPDPGSPGNPSEDDGGLLDGTA